MAVSTVATTKIAMPIVFQAESQSMKKVFEELKAQMSQVDLSSNLGKKFVKALEQMKKSADAYDTIAIEPTLDQTGLNTLRKEFANFWKYAKQLGRDVDFASVFDFNLSKEDLTSLNAFSEKIKELNSQLTLLKKNGSKQAAGSALTAAGQTDLLERARLVSNRFDSGKTARANSDVLNRQAAGARDERSNLVERQTALQQAAETLVAQQRQIQLSLRTAESELQKTQSIVNRGNFLRQYEGLNEKILRTEGGRNRGQTAVLSAFMRPFEQGSVGGRVAEVNRIGAESILRYLGFDTQTIEALLREQIPQIREAIARALDIDDGSDEALSNEAYERIQNVRARSRGYMRQHATEERYTRLPGQQSAVRDLRGQLETVNNNIRDNANDQQAVQNRITEINTLIHELDSVSEALRRFQQELDRAEIDKLNDEIENQTNLQREASGNIRERYSEPIRGAAGQRAGNDEDYNYAGQQLQDAEDAKRESEQFTDNLKASIKHWMSAQQIISLIKQGVRQAWTDIQGLDKAMTNIAVVTDMSTDDLWGKINEYMSIAQEYGVTTQGVYEVSQLYYQQGLSASEVMEATTETLKMARIAGMGYAEAADAMTVAIRGFKMEMSDAQTVTDVYSKVAAVTASDTEELATAMSKTASSAESVGSSFENTTAMLAVMIETTRESAQNLGSALKSMNDRKLSTLNHLNCWDVLMG